MNDAEVDSEALRRQLAALALPGGEAGEVLLHLAEVIFPPGTNVGDPARMLWPERGTRRQPDPARKAANAHGTLEADLRQSEDRFQALVEQLPAVVFFAALGQDDNEVYVSPQIETLLGFSQREWLDNPILWYTQLHPDDHDVVIEAFTHGVQTGEPFRAQVRFRSRSGEEVWIQGEARLILDDNERPAYFQGVAFDITPTKHAQQALAEAERAKAEAAQLRADVFATRNLELTRLNEQLRVARDQAEAAARARSAFLTTMSHELRTPLNSVTVLSGLLAESELSSSQRDMVRRLRISSEHLLELVNDVLELSRLRAGHVELHERTFRLDRWLADTVDIVAARADEKGLAVRHRIEGDTPLVIRADSGRLRQVLVNLLGNAVKFTAHGRISVVVAAVARGNGRWEFECSVHDTGVGIDPGNVAALFDEFRQADSGIAREYGGTGLGLAICKQVCEILGGRIWVDVTSGPGATVRFTWMADEALPDDVPVSDGRGRHPEAGDPDPQSAAAPVARSTLRILVVDDDPMNQYVAELLLDAMGHRADVVNDGREAIAAVGRDRYDIVLMDMAMPVVDGLLATRMIRHLGDTVHQPYIIALTANALPGDVEACLEAGMNAYVAKPIVRRDLAHALTAGAESPAGEARRTETDFDPSRAVQILEQFGRQAWRELLAMFTAQAARLSDATFVAVAAGNAEEAARAAHTLKSNAAVMGATGLTTLCADLETLARSGSLVGTEPITAVLGRFVEEALVRLNCVDEAHP